MLASQKETARSVGDTFEPSIEQLLRHDGTLNVDHATAIQPLQPKKHGCLA
jgi:hypothetical protein